MLYFNAMPCRDGSYMVAGITADHREQPGTGGYAWICRADIKSYEQALLLADAANAGGGHEGGLLIATDSGPGVWPRYDVVRLPTVGDLVSYSFNGDTYPDGTVVSISDSKRLVKTSTGGSYYRRRLSGAWVKDGTWSLVAGHVYTQNREF